MNEGIPEQVDFSSNSIEIDDSFEEYILASGVEGLGGGGGLFWSLVDEGTDRVAIVSEVGVGYNERETSLVEVECVCSGVVFVSRVAEAVSHFIERVFEEEIQVREIAALDQYLRLHTFLPKQGSSFLGELVSDREV